MLNNIHLIFPELFILISISIQLIAAVIYSKLEQSISQQLKTAWISFITLIIASIMFLDMNYGNIDTIISENLLRIDILTNTVKAIICCIAGVVIIMSTEPILEKKIKEIEFSIIILLASLGFLIIIGANELITLYLGIELYSLSLYILASINKWSEKSTEAGLKYFVLGSLGSGLYLFGASLLYFITGELTYEGIQTYLITTESNNLIIMGAIFILIALLFKIAAGPLHMWAPDVYDGAPTIVTSFFAAVPKLALLTTLIHILYTAFLPIINTLQPLFIVTAIFSMLIGSITGLNQSKIKRLVAYSSISHIGFILIGLSTCTLLGLQVSIIYTLIYIVTTISLFAAILMIFKNSDFITEIAGFGKRNPVLAFSISLLLFSTAGVPPLAGFYSKFIVLTEALAEEFYFLTILAVISSSIALIYYIRVTKWMFFKDSSDYNIKIIADIIKPKETISLSLALILGVSMYLVMTILFYPIIWIKLANYLILASLI